MMLGAGMLVSSDLVDPSGDTRATFLKPTTLTSGSEEAPLPDPQAAGGEETPRYYNSSGV